MLKGKNVVDGVYTLLGYVTYVGLIGGGVFLIGTMLSVVVVPIFKIWF